MFWTGLIALILLIATAAISSLPKYTKLRIHIKWHKRVAIATILIALFHGILGLASYL
jgi:hypothetical protein